MSPFLESTPPVLQLENPSPKPADPGECYATVNFTMPTGSDDSGHVLVSSDGRYNSGDQFPVGETKVDFTAVDPSDNIARAHVMIVVTGMYEI